MSIGKPFAMEVQQESIATRQMLERIPAETFDWKPHEKSMSMQQLSVLVADMFGWLQFMAEEPELDFAKGYEQAKPTSTAELVEFFDKRLKEGLRALNGAEDAVFTETWKLRNGDQIYMETTKLEVIRQTINHMVHHRGQLSVYLRLRDIAVPSIYGPSADEGSM